MRAARWSSSAWWSSARGRGVAEPAARGCGGGSRPGGARPWRASRGAGWSWVLSSRPGWASSLRSRRLDSASSPGVGRLAAGTAGGARGSRSGAARARLDLDDLDGELLADPLDVWLDVFADDGGDQSLTDELLPLHEHGVGERGAEGADVRFWFYFDDPGFFVAERDGVDLDRGVVLPAEFGGVVEVQPFDDAPAEGDVIGEAAEGRSVGG